MGRQAFRRVGLLSSLIAFFVSFATGCSLIKKRSNPPSVGSEQPRPPNSFRNQTVSLETRQPHLEWPITHGVISSGFGIRHGVMHKGVDIAAPVGTPIHAADSGQVAYVGRVRGYGRLIILRHDAHFVTVYAHCQRVWVVKNQYVTRGQIIGTVGRSGNARGSNLHFEVRVDNRARNPLNYMDHMPPSLVFARRSGY